MKRVCASTILGWLICLLIPTLIIASENTEETVAKKEIITRLENWSKDFNAKNIPGVCGLFANDLVASYPGTMDRNYEEMCRHLKQVLLPTNQILRYETPEIEQMIFAGDVVVVRLIWTLKIASKDQTSEEIIKEKGLDVFKRQKDGSWKIQISYAYPIR